MTRGLDTPLSMSDQRVWSRERMNYLDRLYRQSKASISVMLEEIEEDWDSLHRQQHADHPHSFEQYSYPRRFNDNQLSLSSTLTKTNVGSYLRVWSGLPKLHSIKEAHSSEKSLLRKANVRHDFLLSRDTDKLGSLARWGRTCPTPPSPHTRTGWI